MMSENGAPLATLPRATIRLLQVEAKASVRLVNEALQQLAASPTLAPTDAATWENSTLQVAVEPMLLAWNTLQPANPEKADPEAATLHAAGVHAIVALLGEYMRLHLVLIALAKQYKQSPATESQSPAPGAPA